MSRILAGSLALLLALGFATPAAGDALGPLRGLAPGPLQGALPLAPAQDQDQDPGQSPPDDAGTLEREKARPTRTITFYGHVFGLGLNAPPGLEEGEFGPDGPQAANTIFPVGDANLGLGLTDICAGNAPAFATPPLPVVGSVGNSGPCDQDPNNKLALFLTAGPVQVHSREEFRYSKLHNEHGRTKDVVLDTAGEVKAWLWMSLDFHAWFVGNGGDDTSCLVPLPPDVGCPYPYWGWDPAMWPQWQVEAKLYMTELGEYGQGASEPPPFLEKWQAGDLTLVAEGMTPPQDVTNGLPGQPNVHEFEISLGAPKVDVIPKTHDVILVYNFYSLVGGEKYSTFHWRVWAGELFPTRFSLPVKNPLDVEFVIPQFVHDKLLVHSVIGSAFGSYDVHVPSARLTVLGPGNRPVEPVNVVRIGDYQVAHGAHFKPVNITWIWDYKADGLAPGAYKALVEACNVQGSACEITEAAFTIDADRRPTQVQVGRSGQRTVSDEQLDAITGQVSAQGFDPVVLRAITDLDAARAAEQAQRAVPGAEGLLAALGAAASALVLRRRWGQ